MKWNPNLILILPWLCPKYGIYTQFHKDIWWSYVILYDLCIYIIYICADTINQIGMFRIVNLTNSDKATLWASTRMSQHARMKAEHWHSCKIMILLWSSDRKDNIARNPITKHEDRVYVFYVFPPDFLAKGSSISQDWRFLGGGRQRSTGAWEIRLALSDLILIHDLTKKLSYSYHNI